MKIGIYGGAFDPIHKEHKKIIENTYSELALDKLILLPSYSPPHKSNKFSPFASRVNMLKEETKDLDYVVIDEREFYQYTDYNYAYEILQQIKQENYNDELIYIIGGDSMIKFHTWAHPEIIASTLPIAVVARAGYEGLEQAITNAIREYQANIRILSFEGQNVSSSLIKANYEFKDYSEEVSQQVNNIIIKEKLYNNYQYYIKKLQQSVTQDLFTHCKGTVRYALKLADKLSLNYEEVFLSALLHDCAKQMVADGDFSKYPKKIAHQYQGSYIAQTEYGIDNPNILNAIKYHTTGKKAMTTLEKLIYCADMLEHNRDFHGVEQLRKTIEQDFDKGFISCVEASLNRIKSSNREVYYLTQECWDYYK